MTTTQNLLLVPLLLFAAAASAFGQETAEERLARLQSESALAKAEAEIAASRAAIAKSHAEAVTARFPTDKVTPLEGTANVKDYSFPPQLLAYSASEQMTSSLAAEVCAAIRRASSAGCKGATVLVYQASENFTAQRAAYKQLLTRAQTITRDLAEREGDLKQLNEIVRELAPPGEAAADFIAQARAALVLPQPMASPSVEKSLDGAGTTGLTTKSLGMFSEAGEALTAVNSTLQTVLQLIALFRTDTDITGTTVKLDPDAVMAQYAHALQSSGTGLRVAYPTLLTGNDSTILERFNRMAEKQSLMAGRLAQIDAAIAGLETRQKIVEEQIKLQLPLGANPSDETKQQQTLALKLSQKAYHVLAVVSLPDLKQRIAGVVQMAGTLDKNLQTPDEKTGISPLGNMIRLERAINLLEQPNTYCLLVKVVDGGGATKTTKNLFTGTKITHLGGAVFISTLVNNAGGVLYTNVSKGFLGYSKLASTGGMVQQDLAANPPTRRRPSR